MRAWGFAVALMALWSGPSWAAEATLQKFLALYDSAKPSERAYLDDIVDATESGMSWANVVAKYEGHPLYCPPGKVALQAAQVIDIMRRYAETNPKSNTDPYRMVMILSLREAFPCE